MTRVKIPYRILPTNSANTNCGMSTYSWLATPNMVQNKKWKVSLNLQQHDGDCYQDWTAFIQLFK